MPIHSSQYYLAIFKRWEICDANKCFEASASPQHCTHLLASTRMYVTSAAAHELYLDDPEHLNSLEAAKLCQRGGRSVDSVSTALPPPARVCHLGGVYLLANESHVTTKARERTLTESDCYRRRKIDPFMRSETQIRSEIIPYFY